MERIRVTEIEVAREAFRIDVFKILVCVSTGPRIAREISRKCGIPINRTYRILRGLTDIQLLAVSFIRAADGKSVRLYDSNVRNIRIGMSAGRMFAVVNLRPGTKIAIERKESPA